MKDREATLKLFDELRSMGFSEKQSLNACRRWSNLQVAIEWLIENEGNESSEEDDSVHRSPNLGSSPVEMTSFVNADESDANRVVVDTPVVEDSPEPESPSLPPLVSPRKTVKGFQRQTVDYDRPMSRHFDTERPLPSASPLEDDLSIAIEKSLQEAAKETSVQDDPYARIRNGSMPVGLKNLGNTCYANSLLQTYYMLPEFRELILSLPFSIPTEGSPNCKLIHELQRLFAFMWASKRKFVYPTPVMRCLLDAPTDTTKIKRIGTQEDPTEFNMLFIERMKEGLAETLSAKQQSTEECLETILLHEEKESVLEQAPDVITKETALEIVQRLFFGDLVDVVTTSEADGTPVEQKKVEEFFQIILDITSGELYQSLDDYTSGEKISDYTTEKGFVTQANRVVIFKRLPEMIAFQLQRLSFNKELKAAVKLDSPFKFQKTIYLDRYLECNASETEIRRARVATLKKEKQILTDKLDKLLRYKGDNVGIHTHLLRTIEFLLEKQESANDNGTEGDLLFAFSKQLGDYYKEVLMQINRYQEAISVLQRTIDSTFDDLKEYEYRLYAALVHDGSAGSGHYWAYLQSEEQANDKDNNKWYKFNDTNVTIVDEDEVWRESRGGEVKNTSAYCLLYVRSPSTYSTLKKSKETTQQKLMELDERAKKEQELSDDNDEAPKLTLLQRLVEKDNEQFAEEIKQWDRANWSKQQEDIAVNEFRLQFEEVLGDTLRDTEREDEFYDHKLKSFHHYLWSIDSQDLAMYEIADVLYYHKYKKHLQEDQNSPMLIKIQVALPHVSIVPTASQRVQRNSLQNEFRSYLLVSEFFVTALEVWQTESEYASLPYFLVAIRKEKKHFSFRNRLDEILAYLAVCLMQLSHSLKRKLLEQNTPGDFSTTIAYHVGVFASMYTKFDFPHVFASLREEWITLFEQNRNKPIAADLEKIVQTYSSHSYDLKVQKINLPSPNLSLFDRYRIAKKSLPERFSNFEMYWEFVKRKPFGL